MPRNINSPARVARRAKRQRHGAGFIENAIVAVVGTIMLVGAFLLYALVVALPFIIIILFAHLIGVV